MLELVKPESGQRKEVYDIVERLHQLGVILFVDDIPNKKQAGEILTAIIGLAREGADGVAIPGEARVMAGAHAFTTAGALLFDGAVTYPDEGEPAPME
jgi:hypothetical protein